MKIKFNKIEDFLLIAYCFLVCLNQYFQFFGIPIFIYSLILLSFALMIEIKKNGMHISKVSLFFLFWILYGIILVIIHNNYFSKRYFLLLLINILGFFNVSYMCDKEPYRIKKCLKSFMIGLMANVIVAFWEIKTGRHIVPVTDDYARRFFHIPLGFFANTNDLSTVLIVMMVLVSIYYFVSKESKRHLFIVGATLLSAGYIVIRTHSIIGIMSMIAIPIIVFLYRSLKNEKRFLITLLIIGVAIVTLLILSILIDINLSEISIGELFEERIIYAKKALQDFNDSLWLGIGPGQNNVQGYGAVHNYLIEVLTEYGIIIFIILLYYYTKIIKKQFLLENTEINALIFALLIILIPLSISTSSLTKLFPIWSSLGVVVSYTNYKLKIKKENQNDFNCS